MINSLHKLLDQEKEVEIPLDSDISTSLKNIKNHTRTDFLLFNNKEDWLVGKVEEGDVELSYCPHNFSNGFAPTFYGKFIYLNETLVLAGKFTLSPGLKAFCALALAFVTILVFIMSIAAIYEVSVNEGPWLYNLKGIFYLGFVGILSWQLISWAVNKGFRDIVYFENFIKEISNEEHT